MSENCTHNCDTCSAKCSSEINSSVEENDLPQDEKAATKTIANILDINNLNLFIPI